MTDDQGDAMTKNNLDHASRCVVYAEGQLHSPITRERGAALSLDDLSAKRDAMGLGLLEECCYEQPESHSCRLVWSGDVPVFYLGPGDDERVKKATVRGLVAEHNAMPVLIEVTRAALRLRVAGRAALRARKEARTEGNASGLTKALTEEEVAADAYDAALAKVTCSVQASPPEDPPGYPCNDRRGHQFSDADGNRVYLICQRCGRTVAEAQRLERERNDRASTSRPEPQRPSTKTDATGILNLLKAWSMAAYNAGTLHQLNFLEWWAKHQNSAERMLLLRALGETP